MHVSSHILCICNSYRVRTVYNTEAHIEYMYIILNTLVLLTMSLVQQT